MPSTRRRTIPHILWTTLTAMALAAVLVPCASAATRRVATTGSDSGNCQSSPCRTFGYANGQSQPGDVVEVAGGSYGSQSIGATSRSGAVTFQPASGATVAIGGLNVGGNNVTIRNMAVGFVDVNAGTTTAVRGVTLENLDATGMYVQASDGLTVRGGDFGPFRDGPMVQFGGSPGSTNTTFDGVTFHDATTSDSLVHMECIWAGGVQGFTVRNSKFTNCTYFNIYFTTLNGPDPRDVLLENNVFEQTIQWNGQAAPYAINISNYVTRAVNYTFRNNTVESDISFQSPSMTSVKFYNNIAALGSCTSGVTYGSNVMPGRTCGSGDKKVAGVMGQFVNPGAGDWHLKAGASAINAADPNNAPELDADGHARDARPDVGAYEWGSSPPVGSDPPATPPIPGTPGTPVVPGTPGTSGAKPGVNGSGAPGSSRATSGATGNSAAAAALLESTRLSASYVCLRVTRKCKTKALLATLVLGSPARLTARVDRLSDAGTTKKVGWFVRKLSTGRNVIKIPRTNLRRGHRYRIVMTATGTNGVIATQRVTFRAR